MNNSRCAVVHDRLAGMLDDDECVGDLLLVGLGLLAQVDLRRNELRTAERLGCLIWGGRDRIAKYRVMDILRRDIRTYRVEPTHSATCPAPMVRRPSCGRRARDHVLLIDYGTGERRPLAHCSTHREWAECQVSANRASAPDPEAPWGGAPLPYANSGGVLARHFPEIDWPAFWRRLDPQWVQHPEQHQSPSPTLSLLIGDNDGSAPPDRPTLAIARKARTE